MNTIFIGGSRHVSRLPAEIKKRLDNVIASGHRVVVGDASGADKAVQKHFLDSHYEKVTVFCSGAKPRNNLGTWHIHRVDPPKSAKGFQFYAAKDREMAREADFGLMIWDGKSPGTVLNVLRMVQAGKISVLFNVSEKAAVNIKDIEQWRAFLARCSPELRSDITERATPEERACVEDETQLNLLSESSETPSKVLASEEAVVRLNRALASGDVDCMIEILGAIARSRGMSHVARDTGLVRESLYHFLDVGGNPEFVTILKVLAAVGLRLEVKTLIPPTVKQDGPSVGRERAEQTARA